MTSFFNVLPKVLLLHDTPIGVNNGKSHFSLLLFCLCHRGIELTSHCSSTRYIGEGFAFGSIGNKLLLGNLFFLEKVLSQFFV
jgi:hypothetical protein